MGRRLKALGLGLSAALLVLAGCGGGGAAEEPAASGVGERAGGADQGQAAAAVGGAGAVRRLLRGGRAGLLRGGRSRRRDRRGRAGHRAAGRASAGDVDYAISWVPKVLGSIEKGAKITNVAQIFERSATTQISFKDKTITEPAQLAGKKVGSWGFGNEWELFAGMQKSGVDVKDITLIQQAFDMNGFLAGDIDAAQAMTYNEYAQVLETKNPDDRRAVPARGPERHRLERRRHRHAAGRHLGQLREAGRPRVRGPDHEADQGLDQGLGVRRDNPEEAAKIVADAGSTLGESHQLWMTNEINKLIWPSTSGIGMISDDAWKQTVDIALGTKNETGATIITKAAAGDGEGHHLRRQGAGPSSGRGRRRGRQGLPADHRRAQGGRRLSSPTVRTRLSS